MGRKYFCAARGTEEILMKQKGDNEIMFIIKVVVVVAAGGCALLLLLHSRPWNDVGLIYSDGKRFCQQEVSSQPPWILTRHFLLMCKNCV